MHRSEQSELLGRFEWLLLIRVIIYSFFVGSAIVFRIFDDDGSRRGAHLLYILIGSYVLTVCYALILRRMRTGFRTLGFVQLGFDLLISAGLVALTGGISSIFSVLYLLTVISASILMDRKDAFMVLAFAVILIVVQVTSEVFGLFWVDVAADDSLLLDILLAGITSICAVFLVTLLTGYLTQQLRDVGQRLRMASRDIESLRALNEQIIRSISSGLVTFTGEREIIFVNPAAMSIIGYRRDDLLFSDIANLFPSIVNELSIGGVRHWENEFRRPDGEYRILNLSLSPLRQNTDEEVGWTLIFSDLTPIRSMEEHVRRSERLAAIGQMAAGIAHEIRNPLASMNGSIQMLSESLELDATESRLMRIIRREADRLNQLVSDFLRYARPNPAQFGRVSIADLLDELVLIFSYLQYGDQNHPQQFDYQLDIPDPKAVIVQGDAKQLRQVFWNLLNNASQAMPDGGEVSIEAKRLGTEVSVLVRDHGVGIESEHMEHIFDPFYSTKDAGTGLGLALVQRIVEDHSGRVLVDSIAGEGTRVSVILPETQPGSKNKSQAKEVLQ
jgi:two-component system sensor histidine kinase PilS (NtrC family)